jgi:hypothetical protein
MDRQLNARENSDARRSHVRLNLPFYEQWMHFGALEIIDDVIHSLGTGWILAIRLMLRLPYTKENRSKFKAVLIVVLPCMLTITQLLLQQNAHFYY